MHSDSQPQQNQYFQYQRGNIPIAGISVSLLLNSCVGLVGIALFKTDYSIHYVKSPDINYLKSSIANNIQLIFILCQSLFAIKNKSVINNQSKITN